jgi:serine protease Do
MDENAKGILVGDVTKDSPAHRAGLDNGDVIVEYNGHEVKDVGEFRNRVAATAPESTVQMTVWRDGGRKTFDVTIGKLAAKAEVASATEQHAKPLGLTVQPLTDELAEKYGYSDETGVVIANVESGSAAALAGLRPGWLIKEVDRKPVHDVDSFKAAVKEALDGETVLLHVHAGDFSRYITLSVEG